eukprot:1803275-Lingulodinium_polyedra.AAC.1
MLCLATSARAFQGRGWYDVVFPSVQQRGRAVRLAGEFVRNYCVAHLVAVCGVLAMSNARASGG